ncbi:MAG: hypothetical protein JKP90_06555 [Desulfofustis sp. PB-SRB1]|nr:hypothetical protein [Desulfofustis sp. PB-SRB1]
MKSSRADAVMVISPRDPLCNQPLSTILSTFLRTVSREIPVASLIEKAFVDS